MILCTVAIHKVHPLPKELMIIIHTTLIPMRQKILFLFLYLKYHQFNRLTAAAVVQLKLNIMAGSKYKELIPHLRDTLQMKH